jgi:hypothetical protein
MRLVQLHTIGTLTDWNLYSESSSSHRRMKQEIYHFSWKVWNFFSYLVQVYHFVWCRETVALCLLWLCSTLLWWSQKRMQCLWKARILRGLSFAYHGTLPKRRHSKKHKQEQNWKSFTILLASVFVLGWRWICHTSYEDYQFCVLCVAEPVFWNLGPMAFTLWNSWT